MTVPVISQSEFALTPLCEEGAKTDAAIRSWEGEFESVSAFYQSRKGQDMPMPAVSAVHTDVYCLQMTAFSWTSQAFRDFFTNYFIINNNKNK